MGIKKQWTGKEKLAIVLQGLKGECSVSELCNAHGITQGMYYKWRDQLLTDGAKLFDRGGVDRVRERLEHENRKLKETIGELTVELKKTTGKAEQDEYFGKSDLIDACSEAQSGTPVLGVSPHLGISQNP